MSVDLIVFAKRSAVPSPGDWQRAIRAAVFPVDLDTDIDMDTFSGFLPCKFRSTPSGFEYFSSCFSEENRQGLGAPEGSDFQVTFATHSDMKEFATSLLAASALCNASNGLLVDPQSGEQFDAEAVLPWARSTLAQMESYLK